VHLEVRHVIRPSDRLEYMGPGLSNIPFTVTEVRTLDDSPLEQANPGLTVKVFTDKKIAWQQYGLVRRVR
jgi:hypothetical protein